MKIETIVKEKNIKLTTARKELLEIFLQSDKPIAYEDIKDSISMNKATFYRNVSKFEDEAIVHSFESNDKKRYYELQSTPHAHFICNNCNTIECLKDKISLDIKNHIVQDVLVKGICQECNQDVI
ncbi:MAG: transcriptional repressor [Campylobacterota bacterium]|nr:transcriptional repressor [Campylobacterota bacterium]